jgi:hypothetical protein
MVLYITLVDQVHKISPDQIRATEVLSVISESARTTVLLQRGKGGEESPRYSTVQYSTAQYDINAEHQSPSSYVIRRPWGIKTALPVTPRAKKCVGMRNMRRTVDEWSGVVA